MKKELLETLRPEEITFKFEPRDLWIGVYWDFDRGKLTHSLSVYICLLPTLCLKLRWVSFSPDWYKWMEKKK